MAKDKLTEYSATNASNDVLGDISVAEGMLPSAVNNAIREQMTHLKNFADGTDGINVLSLEDDDGSHAVKLQAPSTVSTTVTYTLPGTDGTSGYVLTTNGSGALSWAASLSNVVEDTSPQLGADLQSNGNDINFGDNDKATFGDAVGGDLQIFHDAGHSRIVDAGSGNLRIQADNLRLQTADGTGNYISADNGGAATLHHNALPKLATTATGADITGVLTSDGLTVDGNKIGISNAAPASVRSSDTVINMQDSFVTVGATNINLSHNVFHNGTNWVRSTTDSVGHLQVANNQLNFFNSTSDTAGTTVTFTKRMNINGGGDVSLYADNGTTQGLFWDASTQRLGLGTTTPAGLMEVKVASGQSGATQGYRLVTADGGGYALYPTSAVANPTFLHNVNSGESQAFGEGGTAHMTIKSGGSVGISTVSPSAKLHVGGGNLQQFIENTSGSGVARLNIQSTTNDGYQHAGIGLQDGTNQSELMLVTGNNFAISHGGSERLRVDGSGNVGIGTSSPNQSLHVVGEGLFEKTSADSVVSVNSTGGSGRSYQIRSQTSGDFYIYDNTAGSARLTIDSSGTVKGTDFIIPFPAGTAPSGTFTHYNNGSQQSTDASHGNLPMSCNLTVKAMYLYVNSALSSGSATVQIIKNGVAVATINVTTGTNAFNLTGLSIYFSAGERMGIKIVGTSTSAAWYNVSVLCERS